MCKSKCELQYRTSDRNQCTIRVKTRSVVISQWLVHIWIDRAFASIWSMMHACQFGNYALANCLNGVYFCITFNCRLSLTNKFIYLVPWRQFVFLYTYWCKYLLRLFTKIITISSNYVKHYRMNHLQLTKYKYIYIYMVVAAPSFALEIFFGQPIVYYF